MTTHTTPLPFTYGKRPDDIEILSRSTLLAGLAIRELGTFLDMLDQVALAPGTCVFREGDEGDYMYFVLEGKAHLRRGQLELATVRAGDHFGEIAMLSSGVRAASVEALTTMRLARLSRARYLSLATQHPRIALHFTQALARSLGAQLTAMTDNVGLLAHQRSLPRRTQVKIVRGADALEVGTGTLAGTVLPQEHEGSTVIAATLNHKPASLETAIVSDVTVGPLTLDSWEGRAIYRRSCGLLLLEAARRALPGVGLRLGPPLDNGQVAELPAPNGDRRAEASALATAVSRLIRDDIPLREEVWAIDEARSYLLEHGEHDAAALLLTRRESNVTLLTCGETFALALGPVVPRAGQLHPLTIAPHPRGLFLRYGEAIDREMPIHRGARIDPTATEIAHPRYGAAMTMAERHWLEGMGAATVGAFNEHCVSGRVSEIIRVAEGFHEKWIGLLADHIATRGGIKVIVIAGPSSSGKTTLIKRLTVQLVVNGIRPVELSLDDYYVDKERTVKDERGEYDFEAFEAIDLELLQTQVRRLLAGELVKVARYDFVSGRSYASSAGFKP
jgi:uridine kinase